MRVLHNIHIMRLTRPGVRILIIKFDLDSAYRRLHVLIRMALLAITIIQETAYVLLRLPFGVANGPSDSSVISEPIFDMSNDLLQNEFFDTKTFHSPLTHEFDKPERLYVESDDFGEARPLFVDVEFFHAKTDGYIDDVITVVLDEGD